MSNRPRRHRPSSSLAPRRVRPAGHCHQYDSASDAWVLSLRAYNGCPAEALHVAWMESLWSLLTRPGFDRRLGSLPDPEGWHPVSLNTFGYFFDECGHDCAVLLIVRDAS